MMITTIAVFYSIFIGFAAIYCSYFEFKADFEKRYYRHLAPVWDTTWGHFFLMAWLVVFITLLGGEISKWLYTLFPLIKKFPAWVAVIHGLSLHGLLLVILLSILKFRPGALGEINTNKISWFRALKKGFWQFLAVYPLVWVTVTLWNYAIEFLQKIDLLGPIQRQDLVDIYLKNDSLLATLALAVLAVLIAPVVEELVFRGILYRFLKSQYSDALALIVSSLAFAILHYNIMTFLPLFLIGALLVRAYERSGSLKVSICFHAFFNLNTVILMQLKLTENFNV